MRGRKPQIELFVCTRFKSGVPVCLGVQKPKQREGLTQSACTLAAGRHVILRP